VALFTNKLKRWFSTVVKYIVVYTLKATTAVCQLQTLHMLYIYFISFHLFHLTFTTHDDI